MISRDPGNGLPAWIYSYKNNLIPLDLREIVLHGMLVTSMADEGTPGEINGMPGYKKTLPLAAGEIRAIPEPSTLLLFGVAGSAVAFLRRRPRA